MALMDFLFGGGNKASESTTSSVSLNPMTDQEKLYENSTSDQYNKLLASLNGTQPGSQEMGALRAGQSGLADTLGRYAQGGFQPSAQDIGMANDYAKSIFAPQQQSLQTSFRDQTMQANSLAASLNRSTNDPILQAKLRTNMMDQQGQLSAQQGAYAAEYAQALPQQRLGYAQQQVGALGDIFNSSQMLANQANQNRSAIIGLGQGLLSQYQNFRLSQASRSSIGNTSSQSGHGFLDVAGAAAGIAGTVMTGVGNMKGPATK